jgi:hypothetical protein
MTPCPPIKVWEAMDEVRPHVRFMAFFELHGMTKPKDGSEPQPTYNLGTVSARASTREEAIAKAEAHWHSEQARNEAARANTQRRIDAAAAAKRAKKEAPDAG